jgi:hypothetical protein
MPPNARITGLDKTVKKARFCPAVYNYETIINLISNTTNRGGLLVRARLDRRHYPIGKRVSDKEIRELNIQQDAFHGEWNYVIRPRK